MSKKPKTLKDLKKAASKAQTDAPEAEADAPASDTAGDPVSEPSRSIDTQIDDAQGQQIKRLLIGLVTSVLVLIGVAAFYLFSNGTAVKIGPDDASETGYVTLESGLGYVSGGNVVYAFGTDFTIGVHAEDFISEKVDITPNTASSFLEVTLKPKPAVLAFTTDPGQDGTKWTLDGALQSTRQEYRAEVEPGSYQLGINHPHFEPIEEDLVLVRAEERTKTYLLSRVQGTVSLQAVPSGGTVTIDGGAPIQLPYAGELPGGQHLMTVEAPGYKVISDQIEVTNTQRTVSRTYRLQPLEAALIVEASPQAARITIDGQFLPNGDKRRVNANQSYRISVTQDGYLPERRSVTVQPGETDTIRIALKEAKGDVRFVSTPPGAALSVNGRPAGQTPQTLSLKTVKSSAEISRPGFRSQTVKFTPVLGDSVTVRVDLLTELQARLRELPPVMLDSTGLELVRFKPDAEPFMVGASRQNDPNQQADEAPRTVRLSKYFYASRYEITAAQYRKFNPDYSGSQTGSLPATGITWQQAAAFCNWASQREGLRPAYNIRGGQVVGYDPYSEGYRLPTEAEWEWLARKANKVNQSRFVWGDTPRRLPSTAGNIADESAKTTAPIIVAGYQDGYGALAPVGSFPAEPSGLYDMSGNAREWVHDRYKLAAQMSGAVDVNPFGPTSGEGNIAKGSSYRSGSVTDLRAARKYQHYGSADDIGFRVVRYVYGAEDR